MDVVMYGNQRSRSRMTSGKHLFASGMMAAGLGAAVVVSAGTATADATDGGTSGPSASAHRDAHTSSVTKKSSARSGGKAKSATSEPDATTTLDTNTTTDETDHGSVTSETPPAEDDEANAAEPMATRRNKHAASPRAVTRHAVTADPPASATPAAAQTAATATATATLATTAETSMTSTAATTSDPVLIAAATSTKVTIGSMIVDRLYSMGILSKKMGTDWLDIPVSQATASRWLVKRTNIYEGVVVPNPGDPVTPPPDSSTPPGTPGTATLLWQTDFSSMSEMLKYWGSQTGRWGKSSGENQYYTDGSNIAIDADGNLVITARREATPDKRRAPNDYTSARISTFGKQSIGVNTRVVARIQMPSTGGTLPAFWSVGLEPGHEYDWPSQGEIDVVELPGLGTPESRQTWTGNIHGPAKWNQNVPVKLQDVSADLGIDLTQGFHDYGMDWYPDHITWDVDGIQVGEVTEAQYEALGGDWTPFSGAWQHYLILNLAVGNPWTGDPDPSEPFESQMKVDWVKAYQL